jgi:hypothetical protein
MLQEVCELTDVGFCGCVRWTNGPRKLRRNEEFDVSPVEEFSGMTMVKYNSQSSLTHANDAGSVPVVFGTRIDTFHVVVNIIDVGW